MDWYLIILRVVHILAGVFWVGSAWLFFFLIEPAVKELGTPGEQFVGHLVEKKKMPVFFITASALAILAGVLLYWRDSGGFDLDWITSPTGIGFTVGGLAAIIAFAAGLVFIKPTMDRMASIGGEIEASDGQPSETQAAELQRLGGRLTTIGRVDFLLLTIAVITMATARYW